MNLHWPHIVSQKATSQTRWFNAHPIDSWLSPSVCAFTGTCSMVKRTSSVRMPTRVHRKYSVNFSYHNYFKLHHRIKPHLLAPTLLSHFLDRSVYWTWMTDGVCPLWNIALNESHAQRSIQIVFSSHGWPNCNRNNNQIKIGLAWSSVPRLQALLCADCMA